MGQPLSATDFTAWLHVSANGHHGNPAGNSNGHKAGNGHSAGNGAGGNGAGGNGAEANGHAVGNGHAAGNGHRDAIPSGSQPTLFDAEAS
jgi:hypothetical protein